MKRTLRRGLAATALAGAAILATPTLASADTLVYTGNTDDGRYVYTNANTGGTVISARFLGNTFDTCVQQVQ